jgi:hypothetical protein
MQKQFVTVAFWLVVALLGANLLRVAIPQIKGQSLSSKLTPYTAVLAETITDPSGARHAGTRMVLAMRKDGSTMSQLGNADVGGRTILLASGQKIIADPKTQMKTTFLLKEDLNHMILDPQSRCTKDITGKPWANKIKVLGEEKIAGHRTVKLQVNDTTAWYALDASCAQIRYRMDFGDKGASEMNLVLLTVGEPDDSLFTVLPSYKEVKPSVGFCGGECPPGKLDFRLQRLDDAYLNSRSR